MDAAYCGEPKSHFLLVETLVVAKCWVLTLGTLQVQIRMPRFSLVSGGIWTALALLLYSRSVMLSLRGTRGGLYTKASSST